MMAESEAVKSHVVDRVVADVWSRPSWMSVLAKADGRELERRFQSFAKSPEFETVRQPEVGMVMVRGRTGGAGDAFNLGEMTVSRAVVRLAGGAAGVGYVAGRNLRHAEIAAIVDAMMQSPDWREIASTQIVAPLAEAARAAREITQRKVAATQVEFFTMVRTREPQ